MAAYYFANHATGTTHWATALEDPEIRKAAEAEESLRIAQRLARLEDTVFGEGKHGQRVKRAPRGSGYLTRLDRLEEEMWGEKVTGSNLTLRFNDIEEGLGHDYDSEEESEAGAEAESEAESEVGSEVRSAVRGMGRLI